MEIAAEGHYRSPEPLLSLYIPVYPCRPGGRNQTADLLKLEKNRKGGKNQHSHT